MRQQFITIGGGVLALACHATILIGGAAAIRDRESAAAPDFVLETPDPTAIDTPNLPADSPVEPTPPVAEQEPAAKTSRIPVRPVEPGLFALPEDDLAQPLERVAPRPPLSEPEEKPKPSTLTLQRPVALAAGLVQSGATTLQLKDIELERAERVCETEGKSWPCGMVARTAFRNFLRGRALICHEMEEKADGATVGACTVGGVNAAEWLVANGWAIPRPGTSLEPKAEAAQNARRGFYGADPRDAGRAPIVVDDPSATLFDGGPGLQSDGQLPN
ncbi:MAG TPA: thermonuclease family protein [Sinorhizobium sp.]|nr:thermonuclease family protein [Sinorhizobium sp.]